MKKCPKCGAAFSQDLSFCPKCGTVFRGTTTDTSSRMRPNQGANQQNQYSSPPRKRRPFWQYILAVVFFPITLTILIAKSSKFKTPVKIALIVVMWIVFLIIGNTRGNEEEAKKDSSSSQVSSTSTTIVSESDNVEELSNKSQEADDEIFTATDSSKDEEIAENKKADEKEIKYHRNKGVNKVITAYNEISESPVLPENIGVSNNGDTGSFLYENGPHISITCNWQNTLLIRVRQESTTNQAALTVFRDLCKSIDPTIDDTELTTAVEEITTGNYNYSYYGFVRRLLFSPQLQSNPVQCLIHPKYQRAI